MKPRHIALGAALIVAAGFAIFGDKTPDSALAEPAQRRAAAAPAPARVAAAAPKQASEPVVMIMRLEPRASAMMPPNDAEMVFGRKDWTPPPPPPPPAPPPPAPTAPPLPFTYVGKALEKGAWEVFLARGSETLIVRNQMVIDGAYRIDAIAPPSMKITYLPLNQVQQLNIGVAE